ncbi:MAG: V-type ATP synthase subunit B [Deltaproteobacteria bacterium]|nr:V-type ATP synthase subunit B [Deltaproteobacteria bacterium]
MKVVYCDIENIDGPILQVKGVTGVGMGEEALLPGYGYAKVVKIHGDTVYMQSLQGSLGVQTTQKTEFMGKPFELPFHPEYVMGRIFDGIGKPRDGRPEIQGKMVPVEGPVVNPSRRAMGQGYIETGIPSIDGANTIVRGQKIPIYKLPGEDVNNIVARIIRQARVAGQENFSVVFGGLGLLNEEYIFFREVLEEAAERTIMCVNLGSESPIERLNVPHICCAFAEQLALIGQHVLVVITDMLRYADALMEVSNAQGKIPSRDGYPGDLYSRLARIYERAVNFGGERGSVTIIGVNSVPDNDLSHIVANLTGYITEGQLPVERGGFVIMKCLSRLKGLVVGKETRSDHGPIMDACVSAYANALGLREQKEMGFSITDEVDLAYLKFADEFESRFLPASQNLSLNETLDLGWELIRILPKRVIRIKKEVLDEYYKG